MRSALVLLLGLYLLASPGISLSFLPVKASISWVSSALAGKGSEVSTQNQESYKPSLWTRAKYSLSNFTYKAKNFFIKLTVVVAIICGVIGIILGLTDKAVFYLDKTDFLISAGPLVIFILFFFLSAITEWHWLLTLGEVLAVINIVVIFFLSFQYNPHSKFAALCTAIGKTALGVLIVAKMMDVFFPSGKTSSERRSNQLAALVIVLFLIPLANRLINGHRVQFLTQENLKRD